MADEADRAQDQIEKSLDANISACRASLRSGQGSEECVGCDEPVPAKRREAIPGSERCVKCQSDYEK